MIAFVRGTAVDMTENSVILLRQVESDMKYI